MSLLIKKRQILAATLIIALIAATGVNWYYNENLLNPDNSETTAEAVSGNLGDTVYVAGTTAESEETTKKEVDPAVYFAEAKLKRDKADDETIDEIEDLIENEELTELQKEKINTLIETYRKDIKAQTDSENLIKAKTGSDCLVIINEGKCQVVLEKNTLNDSVILQISEIIRKNANISAENLIILEING